jgi:hypothetical protein
LFLRCSYAPLRKCEKSWIQREKTAAKILVYGFYIARINRFPKPRIELRFFSTGRAGAAPQKISTGFNEIAQKTRRQHTPKGLSLIMNILKETNPFFANWRVENASPQGK